MDPARLLRDMSPRTLGMWLALAEIDPWDENRGDLRAGEIAAVVANAAGAKRSDGGFFEAGDFTRYDKFQRDPDELRREHDEKVAAALRAWLDSHSGHKAARDRDHLKEP